MSLRLWLIRHGESTWNAIGRVQGWADPPLSELGQWQAKRVAQRLASEQLTAIYSSTLQRAYQTAQRIAEISDLDVLSDPRLREHGMGEATGMDWGREAFFLRWPFLSDIAKQGQPIRTHIPGAEPEDTFAERVHQSIAAIRGANSKGDVAVVAHGGVFRTYLTGLLKIPLGNVEFSFGNVSLSLIEFTKDNFAKIRFVNDCNHLIDYG